MKAMRSERKGKKYKVRHKGKVIHFGAKGYTIAPSTKRGDSYCARSYGIKDKSGRPTRNKKSSPNYWSRKMWKCKGKKSGR